MPTTPLAPSRAPADVAHTLKQAWRDGGAPDVLGALRDHPDLLRHRSLVVDLAFEEYCLRDEAGQAPDADDFCRALPAFRSDVRAVLRDYRALADHPELFEQLEVRWPETGEDF